MSRLKRKERKAQCSSGGPLVLKCAYGLYIHIAHKINSPIHPLSFSLLGVMDSAQRLCADFFGGRFLPLALLHGWSIGLTACGLGLGVSEF
mmetsp:Transcript_18027/g.29986  ORF Transcript_18027/g.29986 Transcript_18027/m.29986 type:complete len:91 (+) Transcript_18027:1614-1886(+)